MKWKKILAAALAAAVTAAMLLFPASAASIADTAKTRHNGDSFSIKLNNTDYHDYKIKLTKSGDLKIKLTSACSDTRILLYDSDGNNLSISEKSSSATTGSLYASVFGYASCSWNSTLEKFKGTVVYKDLGKGTYYLRIYKDNGFTKYSGQGKTSITLTFPGETAEDSGTTETKAAPALTVTVKAGETLPLGVSDADGEVTWSTSKKSVAEVDQNGNVTAKKAGSAVVTAKTGKTALTVTVIVA